MSISVLNTDSGTSGKTIALLESTAAVTGLWSFNRSPNPPFAVQAGSAYVANLDADKLDGLDSTAFLQLTGGTLTGGLGSSGATLSGSWGGNPTFSGTVTLGTINVGAGNIVFPAAQSASAGANTLDDYEEGSWTPTIGGAGGTSGQTYTLRQGFYVKIGRYVFADYYVRLSVKGTITGAVQIQGLPFTDANEINTIPSVVYFDATATNWTSILAAISPGTTAAAIVGIAAATTTNTTALATADISATTLFAGTIIYRANA
jgi:hypothetical protein